MNDKFEAKKPPEKDRHEVLAMITYSISNAYIIVGESDKKNQRIIRPRIDEAIHEKAKSKQLFG